MPACTRAGDWEGKAWTLKSPGHGEAPTTQSPIMAASYNAEALAPSCTQDNSTGLGCDHNYLALISKSSGLERLATDLAKALLPVLTGMALRGGLPSQG